MGGAVFCRSWRPFPSFVLYFCCCGFSQEQEQTVFVKGASELVLEDCTHAIAHNGERVRIDDATKQSLLEVINHMADQGMVVKAWPDPDPLTPSPHRFVSMGT